MKLPLLFKHFWVAFVLVTLLNGAVWWFRSKPHRQRDPSLTDGYRALIRGFVTWANVPWLIMGAGILFGGVPSMFHYFDPRSPNPFVTAWFGSIFFLWVAGTYWLFARGGAERLVRHSGLLQPSATNATAVKALWLLAVASGPAAVAAMYLGHFRSPNL